MYPLPPSEIVNDTSLELPERIAVAVACSIPPPVIVTVGAEVYPEPLLVTLNPVIFPLLTVAVAVACVVAPPPVIVTVGSEVYPEPELVTSITSDKLLLNVAVAVAYSIPPPVIDTVGGLEASYPEPLSLISIAVIPLLESSDTIALAVA